MIKKDIDGGKGKCFEISFSNKKIFIYDYLPQAETAAQMRWHNEILEVDSPSSRATLQCGTLRVKKK